jgi:hypothetical protein
VCDIVEIKLFYINHRMTRERERERERERNRERKRTRTSSIV